MMCSKCQEYEWRDSPPLKVVYKDSNTNKGYCLFHAPVERKVDKNGAPIRVSDFNSEFFAKVEKEHSKGQDPLCVLQGIIFPGPINFSTSPLGNQLKPLALQNSIFKGTADFRGLTIQGLTLDGSVFELGAVFSDVIFETAPSFHSVIFSKRTHFGKATFCNGGMFIAAEFAGPTWFSECLFHKDMLFHSVESEDNALRMHKLSKESLACLRFSSLEVGSFSFKECPSWPDNFGFENEEITSYKTLEELYRAMKQKAAGEHDQPMVSWWHYREKLMAMKRGGNSFFEGVMLRLYFFSSGFGERALQALGVLLVLLALSFLANSIKEPWVWSELPGSAAAQYTMASIPFAKDIPGDGWVKVARGFWQFLIAVQFTLFALAVRNRFRR